MVNFSPYQQILTSRIPKGDPEENARVDLQILMQTLLQDPSTRRETVHIKQALNPRIAVYAKTAQEPNWDGIISAFKVTTKELKGARLLRMLSRGNIFSS